MSSPSSSSRLSAICCLPPILESRTRSAGMHRSIARVAEYEDDEVALEAIAADLVVGRYRVQTMVLAS